MQVAKDSPQSGPIGILLVEDEPAVRLLLRRWIERALTAEIWEAGDGLQALETIAEQRIELIIADVKMPLLNGLEMLMLLRSDPSFDRVEVLVASEVAERESVKEPIELGVSDYLLKPLQYDWVTQRLRLAAERILALRNLDRDDVDRSRTRVLVADADPNYCQYAESAFSGEFSIRTARTVPETLVKALRFKPDAVLLGTNLPGLKIEFLVDRLTKLTGMESTLVYELTSDRSEPSDPAIRSVIHRSFVPENLRGELLSALGGGPAPQRGVLSWVGGLTPELDTAFFQALGMMTGQEPVRLDAPIDQEPKLFGSITIDSDDQEFEMRLRLDGQPEFAGALQAAMLGEDPDQPLDGEPEVDGLQDVLNVVAGRIKNSCLGRKIAVTIGLPVVGPEACQQRKAQSTVERTYQWRERHQVRLTLLVATKPRAEDVHAA